MFNIATTFAFSVLSVYSLYHAYIASSSELDKLSIVHIVWTVYYMVYDTIIIAIGSNTAKEVRAQTCFLLQCKKSVSMSMLQGKRTAILLHRVINRCDNDELVKRVSLSIDI